MKSRTGVIQSPNYPLSYPSNYDCEWIIEVAQHHTITLILEDLDLENYYDCEMDYVEAIEQIGDDQKEHQLFKKCGSMDSELVSNTHSNLAIIRFKSDYSNEGKGFKLSFKENCGESIIIDENDFDFIEISGNAYLNETCKWQIISKDLSKHILLTPTHIQLNPTIMSSYHSERDCANIGAKIYDGLSDISPLRSQFCKSHTAAIISNGHALTIVLPLNVIYEFEAEYMIMDNYCGGNYHSIMGKFASPYYPSSYPVNIDCIWYIEASAGNSIVLTVEMFNIENSYECNKDYFEIRENDSRGKLLGLYCGSEIPVRIDGSRTLWINFKSDGNVVGEGFLATYSYKTHNEVNGSIGIIESPKYPTKFESTDEYSWRITVDKDFLILVSIKYITDTDIPFLKFYDGYSDIGTEIDYSISYSVRSSTNILFLTATRGPFHIEWERLPKDALRTNRSAEEIAGSCGTTLITVDGPSLFNSPGYPTGYSGNLNCSWILIPKHITTHTNVQFRVVDLEDFAECNADFVTVSTSTDLKYWIKLKKFCRNNASQNFSFNGTPYLRLTFVTDYNINKTGFSSYLSTVCGSQLSSSKGFVNITDLNITKNTQSCLWKIRVRQSQRIRLSFLDSEIENHSSSQSCTTYFVVRNGINDDSPFLGKGKYCENNITDILETSGNKLYVKFVHTDSFQFKASFHYEEIHNTCSRKIVLSKDSTIDQSTTISTPNYPNIPNPHSECIWKISAPIHHIIAIDFFDKFDLAEGTPLEKINCDREYVQLFDGATELMPIIGTYCGTIKPDTIYTTGNNLRIKYLTDMTEPHSGFIANISIGFCGGSYYSSQGIINSPVLLNFRRNKKWIECIYNIEVNEGNLIKIEFDKIQLPTSENCSDVTHLEITDIDANSNTKDFETKSRQICGNYQTDIVIESNKVRINYKIRESVSSNNLFKISYSSIGSRCGETIVANQGILQTPGYPNGIIKPTHCIWRVKTTKGKRIKVELLDFDTGEVTNTSSSIGFRGRVSFSNDFHMLSIISRIWENPPTILYSTDNILTVDVFLLSINKHRGIKLKFTSDEESIVCPPAINLSINGVLNFNGNENSSIYCNYYLKMNSNTTLVLHVVKLQKFDNSTYLNTRICRFISPLKLTFAKEQLSPDFLCKNESQPSIKLPFPVTFEVFGDKRNNLRQLEINYTTYNCGGILTLRMGDSLTITLPNITNFNDKLECAWAIWPNENSNLDYTTDIDDWIEGIQIEFSVSVNFINKCEDEYISIFNGPNQNSPHLGRYCNQQSISNLVTERGLFFEYFTRKYENQSTFNVTAKEGSGCGGILTYPYRDITFSEQYKNNVECIWEISTKPGFHLGVTFLHRFFIEYSSGCVKDYLKVQQKSLNGSWEDLKQICGRDPPKFVNTTTSEMRLIFKSDDDIVADGFTVQIERNCGGILYATLAVQEVSSPGYPKMYGNNLYCNYTILANDPSKNDILVRFIDFQIEWPPISQCIFDNVTIEAQDKLGAVNKVVLCGVNNKNEFRATNQISIILQTDQSFASKGFLLEFSIDSCGGHITNSTIISSPQQDDSYYPPNTVCIWNLTAPIAYKILIKFEKLDFESQNNCEYDAVEIYNESRIIDNQRLVKLCGNLTGNIPIITIPNSKGLIRSFSDERDLSKGFKALISFVSNCDRTIFLDLSNVTYEFDLYAAGYKNNLDCTYLFSTIPGRQLQIKFTHFHIEDSFNCQSDYVEVRDGTGPFSDAIGRFCGNSLPTELISSRNALYMRFVTDSKVTSSGFIAILTSLPSICGQRNLEIIQSNSIVLKAPENTSNYTILNCFWKIKVEKYIHIKFDKLNINYSNGTCSESFIKIYNKEDASMVEKGYSSKVVFNGKLSQENGNFASAHVYCGSDLPDDYFSTGKELYIKYRSKKQTNDNSFILTATEVKGCFRNFTGTQGRVLIRDTATFCDIYINAPQNYFISLYYDELTFAEYNCSSEFIEIFDVHTNKSLQKLCAYMEPSKSLFTNTNQLRMHFMMNGLNTEYDVTYLASKNSPGCGGKLYNTAGVITSPFYPNNVRNNSDCRWDVQVPNNLYVLLSFKEFDLGAKATCHSDYLEIIEYENKTEKVVDRFCGEDHPSTYVSNHSLLTIHFHKTVNYDGTGWVIRFNGVYANYKYSTN